MSNNKPMRVAERFSKDVEDVIQKRLIMGKDRIFDRKPSARITEGISRHPLFRTRILPDLIKADMPKRSKNE